MQVTRSTTADQLLRSMPASEAKKAVTALTSGLNDRTRVTDVQIQGRSGGLITLLAVKDGDSVTITTPATDGKRALKMWMEDHKAQRNLPPWAGLIP